MCNYDKREEAKTFEDHAVGTQKDSRLVVHVPVKLPFLFCQFIEQRNNEIFAEVKGGRKHGNGLVLPCIYHVNGNKKHLETFSEETNRFKKGKATHMKREFFFLKTTRALILKIQSFSTSNYRPGTLQRGGAYKIIFDLRRAGALIREGC